MPPNSDPNDQNGFRRATEAGARGLIRSTVNDFKDAPPTLRGPVFILAIVAAVFLAISGVFYFTSNGQNPLPYFLAFLAMAVICLKNFTAIAKTQASNIARQTNPLVVGESNIKRFWSRPLLEQPLEGATLEVLQEALELILLRAHETVAKEFPKQPVSSSQMRANIFLAEISNPGDGYACWLTMAKGLQLHMEGHPDAELKLRPGQGSTGKVYVDESPHMAKANPDPQGKHEFDSVYALTKDQSRILHPDLRWIVSVPLRVSDKGREKMKTVGVINIDGLGFVPNDETLDKVSGVMLGVVMRDIQPKLESASKLRLFVGAERIQ